MLVKLLKHEFSATARTLLPVYAALLAMTLLMRLTNGVEYLHQLAEEYFLMGMFLSALSMLYVCVITAVFVVTAILLIQRFYKNLLRDEGYLMHTLPVATWQLTAAKLIPAVFWCGVTGLAAFLSMNILFTVEPIRISDIIDILTREGFSACLLLLEGIALVIFTLTKQILQVYLSLAIGHLANSFRILWSIGAYIGISCIANTITIVPLTFARFSTLVEHLITEVLALSNYPMIVMHISLLVPLLLSLLFGALYFTTTNWLMKHKLNLE